MHAVITSQMMVSDNVFFFFFSPAGTTFNSGTTYLRERGEAIMFQRKKSKKNQNKKPEGYFVQPSYAGGEI